MSDKPSEENKESAEDTVRRLAQEYDQQSNKVQELRSQINELHEQLNREQFKEMKTFQQFVNVRHQLVSNVINTQNTRLEQANKELEELRKLCPEPKKSQRRQQNVSADKLETVEEE